MNRKTVLILVVVVILAALIWGLSGGNDGEKTVTVGAKNFTEQYVLGSMISCLLQDAGFKVNEQFGTGSTVTREGLATGQTDLYPEYTGTAWAVYLDHSDVVINDPVELYNRVKEEDQENNDIIWLDRTPVDNTYALAVKSDCIDEYGASLSDLAEYNNAHPGELIYGTDQEFYERADGFWEMAEVYGMEIDRSQVKMMDVGLTFEAIDRGQIDVAMVFATDGKLREYNLVVLEDNKQFFPVYNMAVTVRKEILDEYPEIEEILSPLSQLLDNETMQTLNYEVDANEIPADRVARDFLVEKGLID